MRNLMKTCKEVEDYEEHRIDRHKARREKIKKIIGVAHHWREKLYYACSYNPEKSMQNSSKSTWGDEFVEVIIQQTIKNAIKSEYSPEVEFDGSLSIKYEKLLNTKIIDKLDVLLRMKERILKNGNKI